MLLKRVVVYSSTRARNDDIRNKESFKEKETRIKINNMIQNEK